jgi:hypothetical protein
MSTAKIRVPEWMLKAVRNAIFTDFTAVASEPQIMTVLESALLAQREELGKSCGLSPMLNGTYQDGWTAAWRHIHRLYDAPEQKAGE